ncbi:MAG: hypothetical protein RBG13Loki_0134 [Promethearchaeota archaeon CR_4]|nr:MAG: hypothetical protein RBG13Loki_0134 [Candidatus Lokiarchaeota archaeon CR_4]
MSNCARDTGVLVEGQGFNTEDELGLQSEESGIHTYGVFTHEANLEKFV